MKSRIIALVLILALALSCFAGCGNSSTSAPASSDTAADNAADSSVSTEEPSGDDSSTTEDGSADTAYTYSTFDYASAYAAFAPDTLVMTVNGQEIYWEEYFGWMYAIVSEIEAYLGTSFSWNDLFSEDYTFATYTQYYAEVMTTQYNVIYNKAMELGLELSEEQLAVIDEAFASDAASFSGGDLAAFEEYLKTTYMSKDYYYFINTVATFYQSIYESMFGVKGENFGDEEVAKFIEENGYLYAKHILFLTVDSAGTALDEAAKAEKLAAAEETLAQLRAVDNTEDMLALFDELMNSLSEDTGLASYPNGYYFVPGEMVQEFEDGTKALDFYGISDIVETSYGYHIILRLPIDPDAIFDGTNSFRYAASTYGYDDIAQEWFDSAEIVYEEQFQALDFDQIFKLVEVVEK